ncbi:MAG TPA: zinc ribbon domain-containing protein [Rectinemataceae bacterium]|nr:zinc ribbon domain-containing protein [Rectinemataceae bacterium]
MPLCPKCGVELAADLDHCPLCGTPLADGLARPHESIFDPEDRESFTDEERRTIAWEVLSVSIGIGIAVVSLVDLFLERRLTWSLYPIASLIFVWLLLTAPLKLRSHPVLAAVLSGVSALAFLLALNLIQGRLDWALAVAIPIAVDAEVSAAAAVFAACRAKRKGVNVIAFGLLAVTLLCVGIEATLGQYLYGRIALYWSAMVATALVPVAGFLFYLHHRVTKKANLRRLFRL